MNAEASLLTILYLTNIVKVLQGYFILFYFFLSEMANKVSELKTVRITVITDFRSHNGFGCIRGQLLNMLKCYKNDKH